MDTTDWSGSRNNVRAAMEESVENAFGISTYTRNALFARKNDPNPGFGVIFTETEDKYNKFLQVLGIKDGSASAQIANTHNVEEIYTGMGDHLNHFDDLTRPFFGKNTLEYNTIWGLNRNRFYRGAYTDREAALTGMAVAIRKYPNPGISDVADEVDNYAKELKDAREAQQGYINAFKTTSAGVFAAIEDMTMQLDRDLGWLKFYHAFMPNAQALVNAFFDLKKIINHGHIKVYTKHVPIGGFVKIGRHLFKPTDMIKITVDGTEDALFNLVADGKTNIDNSKGFRVTTGTTVEKPVAEVFPEFENKNNLVIASNASMTNPTHVIFEIIEA